MSGERERAGQPEDLARLFVERVNAGDAEGLAALYEPDAIIAYPPGRLTVGREAIRALFEQMIARAIRVELEEALPSLRHGDLALTGTRATDVAGARAQVARLQPDGSWLRILDRPEPPPGGQGGPPAGG
ncbi:MAG TPA: nuclear transport factor 2 family protein [Verrucomicrobiae bacterium]|nr:nuclear transport factor 2 family protein [Verrucomicrobiae bacterium]